MSKSNFYDLISCIAYVLASMLLVLAVLYFACDVRAFHRKQHGKLPPVLSVQADPCVAMP